MCYVLCSRRRIGFGAFELLLTLKNGRHISLDLSIISHHINPLPITCRIC